MTNKYPIVQVRWEDITSSDSTWRTLEEGLDAADSDDGMVTQIGFQIDATEHHIILTDAIQHSNDFVGTVTKIPMGVVRDILILG